MLSQKVRQILEMLDTNAEQEGMPRYEALEDQLQGARQLGDKRAEADLLQQMGLRLYSIASVARSLGRRGMDNDIFPAPGEALEPAIELFLNLLEIAKDVGDEDNQRFALNYLGDCYFELDRFEEALEFLGASLNLIHMPEDAVQCFQAAQKAGDCYLQLGNDEKALAYYEDGLEAARIIDDPFEIHTQLGKIASALNNLKRYDEALVFFEQARDLLVRLETEVDLQQKIVVHRNLFSVSALPNLIAYTDGLIARTRERQRFSQSLAGLPKAALIRYRHADHYLKKLEGINDQYRNSSVEDRSEIIGRFEAEWEQIKKGQAWAASSFDQFDLATGFSIDYALTAVSFLDERISVQERFRWNATALMASERQRNVRTQSELLTNTAYNYIDLGNPEEAQRHFERALQIGRELKDPQIEGRALVGLGELFMRMGRFEEALRAVESGQSLLEDPEAEPENSYLPNLMLIYLETGRYAEALDVGERDLLAARQAQDAFREAKALGNLGLVHYGLGRYPNALDYHQRALAISRKLGDRRGEAANLGNTGSVYIEIQQFEQAEACFDDALRITRELGDTVGEENCLGNLGTLYKVMGRYEEAIEKYGEARAIALKSQHRAGEAMALHGLGSILLKRQKYNEALAHFTEALAIEQEIGRPEYQSINLYGLGGVYSLNGQFDEALKQYQQSLDLATALGNKFLEARARLGKAAVQWKAGKSEEALPEARQARDLFEELGSTQDIEAAELTISQVEKALDSESPASDQAEIFRLLISWTDLPTLDVAQSKTFLLEHQEKLLTEKAESILQLLIANEPDNRNLQRLARLLREARVDGIEPAYKKHTLQILGAIAMDFDQWKNTPEARRVVQKLVDWVRQPDKDSSKEFLEANKEDLLTVNAMLVLELLGKGDSPEARGYQPFVELHTLCRNQGIDHAYTHFDTLAWHSDMMSLVKDWVSHSVNAPLEDYFIKHQDRLISYEAEFVLSEWYKVSLNWGIEQFLKIVQSARKDGIDKAIEEYRRAELIRATLLELMRIGDWNAKQQFALKHADELITDAAERTLQFIANEEPEQGELAEVHRILLRDCRRDGIEKAFQVQAKRNTPQYGAYLSHLFITWLGSPTLAASKTYLMEQKEDLLTEWALFVVRKAAQQAPDSQLVAVYLKLLETSLEIGIEKAYKTLETGG